MKNYDTQASRTPKTIDRTRNEMSHRKWSSYDFDSPVGSPVSRLPRETEWKQPEQVRQRGGSARASDIVMIEISHIVMIL